MSSQPLEQGQVSRQEFVRGVAALVMPIALGSMSPLPAFAGDDALKKIEDIPLTVLQTIAGGSVKVSFCSFKYHRAVQQHSILLTTSNADQCRF